LAWEEREYASRKAVFEAPASRSPGETRPKASGNKTPPLYSLALSVPLLPLDRRERHAEGAHGNRVERALIAHHVKRRMRVHEGLARRERGGRRARLELVEAPERGLARLGGAIVVAVDDVAAIGLGLDLPHAVHVIARARRLVVDDRGEKVR